MTTAYGQSEQPDVNYVSLLTGKGRIIIALTRGKAADAFARAVLNHRLEGARFKRNLRGALLQADYDPTAYDGAAPPPRNYRYRVGDVAVAATATDPPGALRGAFFIVTGTPFAAFLNDRRYSPAPQYAVIGHVVPSTLKIVRHINQLGILPQQDGRALPDKVVKILKARAASLMVNAD